MNDRLVSTTRCSGGYFKKNLIWQDSGNHEQYVDIRQRPNPCSSDTRQARTYRGTLCCAVFQLVTKRCLINTGSALLIYYFCSWVTNKNVFFCWKVYVFVECLFFRHVVSDDVHTHINHIYLFVLQFSRIISISQFKHSQPVWFCNLTFSIQTV